MRLAFLSVQCLDGFATTTDNVRGLLPDLIGQGGFKTVARTDRFNTIFGALVLLRACKSG